MMSKELKLTRCTGISNLCDCGHAFLGNGYFGCNFCGVCERQSPPRTESETEQKLNEAVEFIITLKEKTSCFRDLDSSGHYDMLRDIDEELNDFLSTIKEKQ
jgi:xylose isomerase